MTATTLPASDTARLFAVSTLQRLLPELVALSLDVKQAHWNVTGPGFLPLHALTDDIAAAADRWADRVAERAVALGLHVDARPETVAAVAGTFPLGRLTDVEAVAELVKPIDGLVETAREALDDLELADIVGHDIIVEILEGLEKYRWLLRAQAP